MTGSGDCFVSETKILTVVDALALIDARFNIVSDTEYVPLAGAFGRVLADKLVSPLNLPPFDNSAMDGYAVRLSDLGQTVPVAGVLYAGDHPIAAPLPGAVLRIFTGAPVPSGLDLVVKQEDVVVDGDAVRLPDIGQPGSNIRRVGEDVAQGQVALSAGRRLRPTDIGLAAALGQERLCVRRPLRVALFSTGNEVTEPGQPLPPGGIYDANRAMLHGMLTQLGCTVTDLGILPDQPVTIRDAMAEAAPAQDLLLTSGGVSAGEADHVKAAVLALGQLDCWKLALKPGKPLALGRVGGTPFAGLPGNPVAMLVSFLVMIRPLIDRLSGAVPDPLPTLTAPAGFSHSKAAGRRDYLRITLGPDGVAMADPDDGAAMLGRLTRAYALAELDEAMTQVRPGDLLRILPFGLLGV